MKTQYNRYYVCEFSFRVDFPFNKVTWFSGASHITKTHKCCERKGESKDVFVAYAGYFPNTQSSPSGYTL